MIEAYEIGIKLALQDGVSEGIAAIRRDLGSLDLAIAQTTLRLNQLQRVGAQALAASQEQPERSASGLPARRSAAVVAPPPTVEAEPVGVPVETRTVVSVPVSRPGPPVSPPAVPAGPRISDGEPAPVSPPIVAHLQTAAPEVAPRLPAIVVEAVRAPGSSRPLEQTVVAPAAGAVLSAPSPTVPVAARLVAPVSQAGDSRPQGEVQTRPSILPKSEGGVPAAPAIAAVPPQQASPGMSRREKSWLSVHRHDEVRQRPVEQGAAVAGLPVARLAPAPVGSGAVFSPTASVAPQASPSYAPPAASPRSKDAGMRGDVFLDGTRVGRWMSEQMARDAGRPNTGPTGFDPRRSPTWPGAAVTW